MNIPQSSLEPFGVIGIPLLHFYINNEMNELLNDCVSGYYDLVKSYIKKFHSHGRKLRFDEIMQVIEDELRKLVPDYLKSVVRCTITDTPMGDGAIQYTMLVVYPNRNNLTTEFKGSMFVRQI